MRLSLDLGLGSVATLNAGGGWPSPGADLDFDFVYPGGRYYGATPSIIRATNVLMADAAGSYESFAAGVLARIDGVGAQVAPARTNLFLNSAAPVTQNITLTNGTVYTVSIVGGGSATLTGAGTGVATNGAPVTFTASGTSLTITVAGSPTYIQAEVGEPASPPIITTGAAATRAGDLLTADLTGKLAYGVAGFIKADLRALIELAPLLEFNDGTGSNFFHIRVNSGQYRLAVVDATVAQAAHNLGANSLGAVTLAFAFGTNYFKGRVVGAADVAADVSGTLPAVTQLAIGGAGYNSTANAFQHTQKLALFYGSPSKPINQAFFDEVYAKAVAA